MSSVSLYIYIYIFTRTLDHRRRSFKLLYTGHVDCCGHYSSCCDGDSFVLRHLQCSAVQCSAVALVECWIRIGHGATLRRSKHQSSRWVRSTVPRTSPGGGRHAWREPLLLHPKSINLRRVGCCWLFPIPPLIHVRMRRSTPYTIVACCETSAQKKRETNVVV